MGKIKEYQKQNQKKKLRRNLEKEQEELYNEIILKQTNQQDSPLTQTEQLPFTTTPIENQQNQSEPQVNLEVLENLMSTLPPELSQTLAMAIPQLQSGSNLLDLVSMMNSLTDEEITDSQLESLEGLFK